MNKTQTGEKASNFLEQKFMYDVNRILAFQKEIEEIQEHLQIAMADAKQLPGKIVQFEKMMVLKEISELLEEKEEENTRLVKELHYSVFPGNIFVAQEFYDFAIALQHDKIVRFSDYLNSIELVNSSEEVEKLV